MLFADDVVHLATEAGGSRESGSIHKSNLRVQQLRAEAPQQHDYPLDWRARARAFANVKMCSNSM